MKRKNGKRKVDELVEANRRRLQPGDESAPRKETGMKALKGKTNSPLMEELAVEIRSMARGKARRNPDWTRAARAGELLLKGGDPVHFEKALGELMRDTEVRKIIFKIVLTGTTKRRMA